MVTKQTGVVDADFCASAGCSASNGVSILSLNE